MQTRNAGSVAWPWSYWGRWIALRIHLDSSSLRSSLLWIQRLKRQILVQSQDFRSQEYDPIIGKSKEVKSIRKKIKINLPNQLQEHQQSKRQSMGKLFWVVRFLIARDDNRLRAHTSTINLQIVYKDS